MTGLERTLGALRFEPVDRPPIAGGLIGHPEFLAHAAGVPDFWSNPRANLFEACRRLGCDAILGPVMPKHPDSTTRDSQGRATIYTKRDHAPTLTTPEQVARWAAAMPSPQERRAGMDHQNLYDEYVALMRNGQAEAADMLLIPHCLGYAPWYPTDTGEFEYQAFLMACALYPDEMAHLFASQGEASCVRLEAVAQATRDHDLLPYIWIGTDICDRKGTVLSPALLERLYFPVLARAIKPLKQAGMKVIWHADANYRRILPRMIDLGLDGFQGYYEEDSGVTLEWMAQQRAASGQPVLMFGSVSTVWVLPTGTTEEVRAAVRRCVRVAEARGGGVLIAPSSSIGPEAPLENIYAMYAEATGGAARPAGSAL